MKKNLLKGLAVVAFAMIAGYNVYQAHSETEGMSELMLANVEALAAGEVGGITCSQRCNDGIGRCWAQTNDFYCVPTGSPNDTCTGICRTSTGDIY